MGGEVLSQILVGFVLPDTVYISVFEMPHFRWMLLMKEVVNLELNLFASRLPPHGAASRTSKTS